MSVEFNVVACSRSGQAGWAKVALDEPVPGESVAEPQHRNHGSLRWVRPCARQIFGASLILAACTLAAADRLTVDFSQAQGVIRPLHGVNMGPLCYRGTVDLSAFHRDIAVPHTRVHDVVWVNAPAVDISTIFPDDRDDPGDPSNYEFEATDDYLAAIIAVGSKIIYRLGESIEHTPRKYRVHPPADPGRWAAVCLGIIRHYNEGWADGFRHDIRYWEIWNEPDVRPAMWTGTDAQYFQLYETAAKAIKARFPGLKVGGPALGNAGTLDGGRFEASAFFKEFLRHCRATGAPLDFFSWHRYTANPSDLPRFADGVRRTLDDLGFSDAESHLNEWNYLPDNDWGPMLKEGQGKARADWFGRMNGPQGAAFAAHALMALQDAPVDVANYFTGEIQGFGLFDMNGTPKKTFHAFKAFSELRSTPVRVKAGFDFPGELVVCAGIRADRREASVLLSSFGASRRWVDVDLRHLPWSMAGRYEILHLDADHDLATTKEGMLPSPHATLSFEMAAPSVALLRLRGGPTE